MKAGYAVGRRGWPVCTCRWTTVGWPHKMVQLMEQVALQWEEDEERFRKLQLSDLTAFNDRVDALTVYTVNQSINVT